jgi:NodT family efflux transporter outer membrane factor (OMF) lipoprotein
MAGAMSLRFPFALVALPLAGCAPTARLEVPEAVLAPEWSIPPAASEPIPLGASNLATLLDAPDLGRLVAAGLADNASLRAAEARIDQAAALLTTARSASLPVVSGTLRAGGSRLTGDRTLFSFNDSFAALDASFDPDLSGRNRATRRAAGDRLRAARLDRDAAAVLLESQIAIAFVQRATLARRLDLLDRSIAQASDLDRIMRIRQREGDATRVDVGLQAIRLRQLQGERSRLSEALAETRTALAVLTGRESPGFDAAVVDQGTIAVPALAVPLPIDLIAARPDIRAAEARLAAAGGDVSAARRAFYPALTLSASAVATSAAFGPILPFATLGSDLLAPIFARSRLRGDLQLSAAQQREAAALYRQAVLEALRNVENALSSIARGREREALLAGVEREALATSGLARRQYLEGDVDLQQLLDAQDLLIAAQDARAIARQDLLAATIALWAQGPHHS